MKPKDRKYNNFIKNIPASKTLKEAGSKAGYSEESCNSYIYSIQPKVKSDLEKLGYTKEALQAEFDRIADLCESKEDYSNLIRALENVAKVSGLFKSDVQVNLGIFQQLTPKDKLDIDSIIDE